MNKRIEKLTELTLGGKMYAQPKKTEFDRKDIFLSREQMESKRLCKFIMNQAPVLNKFSKMTGFFNCDESVVGDIFRRMGNKNFNLVANAFYLKPIYNLSTFEWQHATADYEKVLKKYFAGAMMESVMRSTSTSSRRKQLQSSRVISDSTCMVS